MNRIAKAALAFIATATLPVLTVAPASAVADDFGVLTVNCIADLSGDGTIDFPLYVNSLEIHLEECQDYVLLDAADSGAAFLGSTEVNSTVDTTIPTSDEILDVTGSVFIDINLASDDSAVGNVNVVDVLSLDDPYGVLLDVETITVPVETDEFAVGDEADWGTNGFMLEGECEVLAGPHAYTTATLTIRESGNYDLRIVDQSPQGSWMHPNRDYAPFDDSVMLVYSELDMSDLTANITTCGDEILGYGVDPGQYWFLDSSGREISGSWPVMSGYFDAGTYEILYTSYYPMTSDDWATGDDGYGYWDPAPATASVELWGPENGGFAGDDSSVDSNTADDLAETGVDPSFGLWTGLSLAGTGVAITAARRRAVRA